MKNLGARQSVWLFLFIVLFSLQGHSAEESNLRTFDQEKIDEFKSQEEFGYIQEREEIHLFEDLLEWVISLLPDIEVEETGWFIAFLQTCFGIVKVLTMVVLPIIMGLNLLIPIILFLMVVIELNGKNNSNKGLDLDFQDLSNQVTSTNWDELIEKALDTDQFNLAVRFLYLKTLKDLDLANKIIWAENKTNSDYRKELPKHLQSDFDRMTYNFEYSWFGEFEIDFERYKAILEHYHSLKLKLN